MQVSWFQRRRTKGDASAREKETKRMGLGRGLGRGMGMGRGAIGAPIARLFANLIVMGSGVLGRHFLEAYKAALQSMLPGIFFASMILAAMSRAEVGAHVVRVLLPSFAQMEVQQQRGRPPPRHENLEACRRPRHAPFSMSSQRRRRRKSWR